MTPVSRLQSRVLADLSIYFKDKIKYMDFEDPELPMCHIGVVITSMTWLCNDESTISVSLEGQIVKMVSSRCGLTLGTLLTGAYQFFLTPPRVGLRFGTTENYNEGHAYLNFYYDKLTLPSEVKSYELAKEIEAMNVNNELITKSTDDLEGEDDNNE